MGSQFSGLESVKRNPYIKRLVDVEAIDENDPFWNQLLSFTLNLPLSKTNSKLLDESIALHCQKFHQNNLKSGNYATLIRVFCRRAAETRKMSDNQLMSLQTANALLLIRCYTKYLIEIENEAALLEQINFRHVPTVSDVQPNDSVSCTASGAESVAHETDQGAAAKKQQQPQQQQRSVDVSSSSSVNTSPRRLYNQNKVFRARTSKQQPQDSQEESLENDSDLDSTVCANNSSDVKYNKDDDVVYQLVKAIFLVCIHVPVEPYTYNLHLEALNTLLILLSVQMYTRVPTHESFVFETIMLKMDRYVSEFVKALLTNTIQQMPAPSNQPSLSEYLSGKIPSSSPSSTSLGDASNAGGNQRSSSLMSSITSGLWTVMTLGFGGTTGGSPDEPAYTASGSGEAKQPEIVTYLPHLPADAHSSSGGGALTDTQIDSANRLLAWQSCHILLVLSNHCTNESLYNPYRLALFHFTDTQDTPTNLPNSEPLPWFSIDYTKLFQMFTFNLHTDQYTLLFYMLLHRNQHFKMFILSRLNIDLLIIPILKVIFTAPERNSHHIYMALIILLILSEDDIFNKTIHNIPIRKLNWYTERSLSEISLGGLLILVVIRIIQFNMTRMRDKYLHTNCLAALANMSSKFYELHTYVCQRINSLFTLLTKKRAKIINLLNEEANASTSSTTANNENDAQSDAFKSASSSPQGSQDLLQDLAIIEELMRMVLEIINSCLTNNLHHNSNLIYSLLYNKQIYLQFRDHPNFQDVIQNIDTIITSFSHEIDGLEDKSIENLKQVIEQGAKQFSRDRFRKFPELKFKYVEEDQPEEFFVPYVWSLVYKFSSLYWVDHTVKLFNNSQSTTANTNTTTANSS